MSTTGRAATGPPDAPALSGRVLRTQAWPVKSLFISSTLGTVSRKSLPAGTRCPCAGPRPLPTGVTSTMRARSPGVFPPVCCFPAVVAKEHRAGNLYLVLCLRAFLMSSFAGGLQEKKEEEVNK